MSRNKEARVLLFDIETSPTIGMAWEMWDTNIIKVTQSWYMLSFSYKWLGDKKAKVVALPDLKGYKKNKKDDRELCHLLWKLIDEADIVIGHNSDKFDIRKANARFAEHGFPPTSPYKTVDTLKVARKYFKFESNKLNELGKRLGVGEKVKTGGFDLWDGCLNDDPKSWALMKRYNLQDTELLERVYLKLRPWMKQHPNMNVFTLKDGCPNCSGLNVQRRGFSITKRGRRQRFQCNDCAAWSHGDMEEDEFVTIR